MGSTEKPAEHSLLRLISEAYAVVVTVYAVAVLLMAGVSLAFNETVPLVGITKSGLPLTLLPVVALLPLSVLLRRWRLVLLLAPVLLIFTLLYGVLFLPRYATASAEGSFTVLTFNVKAPFGDEIPPIIDLIRTSNADVVAMQEMSYDLAQQLAQDLREAYPQQATELPGPLYVGQGILSRYPIVDVSTWRNDELGFTFGHQRAELALNDQSIVIYNTHPLAPYTQDQGFNASMQNYEVDGLLDRAASETHPVLLTGDFNMPDQFTVYRRVTQSYVDTYREAGEIGFGFTFPGDHSSVPPFLRLDYVFHDEQFTGLSARVWPTSGSSDHRPLFVRLALMPAA